MNTIKCNRCQWAGSEIDLLITDDIEQCPGCGASDSLMDIERELTTKLAHFEAKRAELSAEHNHNTQ